MKKLNAVLVLLSVLFFTNSANAHIWRVNNNAGVVADFTTVQAAHDAATAGDTIHLEQGSYGALTMTKTLVVIGSGYYLSGSGNLGLQANSAVETYISSVTFNAGSSNSVVTGCTIGYTYIYASNVTLKRDYLTYWIYLYANANNLTINGNYIYYGITQGGSPQTGLAITNNIIAPVYGITLDAATTGTFENNTMLGGTLNVYNFQIDNNIFQSVPFYSNNSVYFNNISNNGAVGSANGNQSNVTLVNNVWVASGTTDGQYQLKAGGPGIGTGYNGVDMGAFGNVNPYKLSGIPSVPTIYSLTVPPTGTTTINVTVSTRSNN